MMSLTANWVSIFCPKNTNFGFSKAILFYKNIVHNGWSRTGSLTSWHLRANNNPYRKSRFVGWVDVPRMYSPSPNFELTCMVPWWASTLARGTVLSHYGTLIFPGEIFQTRWLVLRPGCLGLYLLPQSQWVTRLFIHGVVAGAEQVIVTDPASVN